MKTSDIIRQILTTENTVELLGSESDWSRVYKDLAKAIHPDVCSDPRAPDAMAKLNNFKTQILDGDEWKDESGKLKITPYGITFLGDQRLIETSKKNYDRLMSLKDKSADNFKRYLPRTFVDGKVSFQGAVGLNELGTVEQVHVNWILSRLLELSAWLTQEGYCHAGINPDSIYVLPEEHGILCTSFYHLKPLGSKLTTISGRYAHFYPAEVFKDKLANTSIDTELSKRTATYLLGDRSGIGNVLKKTHLRPFLDFLQQKHDKPYECFIEYRELLRQNFDTKKFTPFTNYKKKRS